MEKVIQEWKVIETDDGFRIEIKGDKEAMRAWVQRLGRYGHRRRQWRHHPPFHPWHDRYGPHRFWCGEEDVDAEEEGPQATQA